MSTYLKVESQVQSFRRHSLLCAHPLLAETWKWCHIKPAPWVPHFWHPMPILLSAPLYPKNNGIFPVVLVGTVTMPISVNTGHCCLNSLRWFFHSSALFLHISGPIILVNTHQGHSTAAQRSPTETALFTTSLSCKCWPLDFLDS